MIKKQTEAISEYECSESEGVTDGKSVTGAVIRRILADFPSGTPPVSFSGNHLTVQQWSVQGFTVNTENKKGIRP